jgi:adenylate cyclase
MKDVETPELRVTRKLTTILHADVAGYSRLMGQDEMRTLQQLKDYKFTVSGFMDRHYGRIINWTGDGLLAEFASVVEAVQCAVEIQRELTARNDLLDDQERMDFRVGINLGDVMVDGNELFGEGVNIAARLQSIAPVGGILVSGTAFDQVRSKMGLDFDFMGRQRVKNIADHIPAYSVVLDPNAQPTSRRISHSTERHADNSSFDYAKTAPHEAFRTELASAQSGPFAGFWRRTIAMIVDFYICTAFAFLISDLTGALAEPYIALIYLIYLSGFESSPWQASIGKRVMGLRVIDERGERLTIMRAFGRNFAKLVSVVTGLFGFLWAAFSERKQGFHDIIANTYIVNEDGLATKEGRSQKFLY